MERHRADRAAIDLHKARDELEVVHGRMHKLAAQHKDQQEKQLEKIEQLEKQAEEKESAGAASKQPGAGRPSVIALAPSEPSALTSTALTEPLK